MRAVLEPGGRRRVHRRSTGGYIEWCVSFIFNHKGLGEAEALDRIDGLLDEFFQGLGIGKGFTIFDHQIATAFAPT